MTTETKRLASNVMTLALGTGAAQATGLLVTPILTRLYAPSAYGLSATFAATVAIATLIATGRYNVAIPLPAEEREASSLVGLSFGLTIVTTLLVLLAASLGAHRVAAWLEAPELEPWLPMMAVSLLLLNVGQVFNYWLTRHKLFHAVSVATISDAWGAAATKIALATQGFAAGGLILGAMVGQFFSAGLLAWASLRTGAPRPVRTSASELRAAAASYRAFPTFELPNALSYAVATRGVTLLISSAYGGHVVGLFALADQLMTTPFNVLVNAYRQAFYPELAALYRSNPQDVESRLHTAIGQLVKLTVPPFVLGLALAPWLAGVIFGSRWSGLATYVHVLAPPILLTLVVAPCSYVLQVMGKQELSLRMNLRLLAARIGALWLSASVFGVQAAVALLLASVAHYVVLAANVLDLLRVAKVALPRALVWLSIGAAGFYAYLFFMLLRPAH